MFAVGAIAVIAMEPHHRFRDRQQIVSFDEANQAGQARIGIGAVVRQPSPPPIATFQPFSLSPSKIANSARSLA